MNEGSSRLLDSINSPDDLKQIDIDLLPQVCDELREFIIDALSCNPGHFGSSLGVVELTVALQYVFNTTLLPQESLLPQPLTLSLSSNLTLQPPPP